jgi:Zn finger protein HypA/HybF involved in hydrogenase expression
MKEITKIKLTDALNWCDENDKSTLFTIQYMMDYAKVQHETVIRFLESESKKQKIKCTCGWAGVMYNLVVDSESGTANCPKCGQEYTTMDEK